MLAQSSAWEVGYQSIATTFGVGILGYKSGQQFTSSDDDPQLTNLFVAAQNDPRMGAAYTNYYNTWSSKGGQLADMAGHCTACGGVTLRAWTQVFEKRAQLRRRQTHHAVLHARPDACTACKDLPITTPAETSTDGQRSKSLPPSSIGCRARRRRERARRSPTSDRFSDFCIGLAHDQDLCDR
jgi:hypothetical protein